MCESEWPSSSSARSSNLQMASINKKDSGSSFDPMTPSGNRKSTDLHPLTTGISTEGLGTAILNRC